MSILNKFENFEVKQINRIDKEDQEWLERREKLYKRAISAYKAVYDIYKSENATYSEQDLNTFQYSNLFIGDFEIPSRIDKLQKEYTNGIFNYFSKKYGVKLENNFKIHNIASYYFRYSKEKPIKDLVIDHIDYHMVLDKIFDQLGGMNFTEKAINEIKDMLKSKCYNSYRDEWQIKIKGNKLIYTGGYCSKDCWSDYYKFNSTDWLLSMLYALSFNTYKEKACIPTLNQLYDSYYVRLEEEDIQNGFSAPSVGVEHIKFYKNGRVDFTFKDAEFCRNFVREWCGYTMV